MTPLLLTREFLTEIREFLEERGSFGFEGTGLIIGGAHARFVAPEQDATNGRLGHSVRVTAAGQMQMALALNVDEIYAARIHSHPDEAFHSPADDANPALTYQGALSIVVPYFGLGLRRGLNACAVYVRAGDGWRELPVGEARRQYVLQADHD